MKKILLCLWALSVLSACSSLQHHTERNSRSVVLASQDATMALGRILARGTGVDVVRAIPPGYSMRGHAAYMKKHWEAFRNMAENADAVLTSTGAWPGDPLYPWARRANLRIVQVDTTRPLDGVRAGVPLMTVPGRDTLLPFVWNTPGNFARMADITAADLQQLYPGKAEMIEGNLRELKQALFRLRSSFEARLGVVGAYEVMALTTDFAYLTDEFGLEVIQYLTRPEHRWTPKDVNALEKALKAGEVRAVLCAWQPKKEITDAIARAGAEVVILGSFSFDERNPLESVVRYYETNLNTLLAALSGAAG